MVFKCFSLLLLFLAISYAQEGAVVSSGNPAGPFSSPDVELAFVLPNNENFVITSGEYIDVLAGFRNTASNRAFNITGVDASLHWPGDYNYILQNFSGLEYLIQVLPESEVSFEYKFMADALLEPNEFGLVVTVYYTDRVNNYTGVVANTTIEVVEADSSIDSETLTTYGMVSAVTLVIAIVLYYVMSPSKKKPSRKVERGTTSKNEPVNEWLEGTHAH